MLIKLIRMGLLRIQKVTMAPIAAMVSIVEEITLAATVAIEATATTITTKIHNSKY